MNSGPGSSDAEHLLSKQGVAASQTAQGSTYLFGVVRKDFDASNFVVQLCHAVTECLEPEDLPLPKDTRMALLGATKEQLASIRFDLEAGDIRHVAITETDGALKGCVTAIGFFTHDREAVKDWVPLLRELKRWKGAFEEPA